jgi:hypothetical protein
LIRKHHKSLSKNQSSEKRAGTIRCIKGVYKLELKSLRLGSNHAVQLSMPLPKRILLFAAELGILLVGIVVAIRMLAFWAQGKTSQFFTKS